MAAAAIQHACALALRHAVESIVRLFDLFLRRAGVAPGTLPVRRTPLSRLTVVCPHKDLADVRKQICVDFKAAGLKVATVQVTHTPDRKMASACVTISCPPELRPALMNQARQLSVYPGVHRVQWGDHRHIVLN